MPMRYELFLVIKTATNEARQLDSGGGASIHFSRALMLNVNFFDFGHLGHFWNFFQEKN